MAYEPEPRDWERKEWLYEKYWGEMQSLDEMDEDYGVGRETITSKMDEFGIPRRERAYTSGNTVSPFAGFYAGNENAQTDEESRQYYDPDAERSEKLQWVKDAETNELVGEKATFES